MKPGISVLGTGRMGSALAQAFLKQGYRVDVWNRTPSKAEPLAALGARVAPSVQDAVAAAEIVIVNVNDYATSERLLRVDGVLRTLRGKLLVQLASGTPKQAREMAAWARQHDIGYLDGAIMATPNLIGGPQCTILYSGAVELFEKYKPVLLALGGNTLYVGNDPGHASTLDNALMVLVWGAMFGALQGAAICQAEKFALDGFLGSIKAMMPAIEEFVVELVKRIQGRRFGADEATQATVDTCHASIRYLLEISKEHGIRHTVLDGFDQIFQAAVQAGRAQDDFAVLHNFMCEAHSLSSRSKAS
jgi:3-hydroxyisobutyrate dehydrogenase-like beta-hydroxyacid dehydrogenase